MLIQHMLLLTSPPFVSGFGTWRTTCCLQDWPAPALSATQGRSLLCDSITSCIECLQGIILLHKEGLIQFTAKVQAGYPSSISCLVYTTVPLWHAFHCWHGPEHTINWWIYVITSKAKPLQRSSLVAILAATHRLQQNTVQAVHFHN